jgi:hypothetical protein
MGGVKKGHVVTSYGVLCNLAPTLGAGSSSRTRNTPRGSMFHPIDTGPFKLVELRSTDSIKAHPQSGYSKPASSTQFSAAHRSLSPTQFRRSPGNSVEFTEVVLRQHGPADEY